MSWVFIDGKVVPANEAKVPVLDRGFLYGDSVYEVTRTYGGEPHLLDEHLDRLGESARRIGLDPGARATVEQAARDTARAVTQSGTQAYLRIIVTRGSGPIGLDPSLADGPRLVVLAL